MLNILIVEDEPLAANRLQRLIKELEPEAQVVEVLDSVKGVVKWLKSNQADLIFLDIHLADGNSFSIFDQVEVNTPIIFSTAYDQYAIKAFKVNSVDYLLKPIEKEDLAASLKKYKGGLPAPSERDLQALVQAIKGQQQEEYQKRFIVTAGDKIKSIAAEEVAYFFGRQKYVFLVTKDNRRHIVDYTLGNLETLLNPDDFFRINRQFIISFPAISNMFTYSKSRIKIEMDPPTEIEAIVSIDKAKRFREWLNR